MKSFRKGLLFGILSVLCLASTSDVQIGNRLLITAWEDGLMSVSQAKLPGSNFPDLIAFPTGSLTNAYGFDDTTDECVYGAIQLSHNYAEGTPLKCHVHWSPLTTSTNTVVWEIDYSISPIGGFFGASQNLFIKQAGGGVAYGHQLASFTDISCPSCGISSVIQIHLCRDANSTHDTDNYVGDAVAHYIDCHYQISTFGSLTPSAK